MWVSDRAELFFLPQTMDGRRLDDNVVVVKLNGKDVFRSRRGLHSFRHVALV